MGIASNNLPLLLGLVAATTVFAYVILLLVRELRGGNRRSSPPSVRPARPSKPAPAEVDKIHEDDGHEITLMGRTPERLDAEDGDEPLSGSVPRTVYDPSTEGVEPTGPNPRILMSAVGATDVGRKRKRNEDSFVARDGDGLYVVADGMGGYAGGDIASKIAVDVLQNSLQADSYTGPTGAEDPARPVRGNQLVWAIEHANNIIYQRATGDEDLTGMGTTLVAARFSAKKQRVFIASVGDSRCYRLRAGKLTCLTVDHTIGGHGASGMGAQLRRALGVSPKVKVDLFVEAPMRDDVYLLCTDGLTKAVNDEKLGKLLADDVPLDGRVRRLIDAANEAGGPDNVTAIVVRVTTPSQPTTAAAAVQ